MERRRAEETEGMRGGGDHRGGVREVVGGIVR